ncbi:MAG: diguanylate cyclase domain-containing protein [Candidatus Rifleibacteriota bacterium]
MKIVITDKSGQILYEGSPSFHGNGIKIGSGNDCDIPINKMGIARDHVQLRFNADGYLTLQDLQSPYGLIVNGQKLQPGFFTIIEPGSYVELAEDVFMLLQPEAGESSGDEAPAGIFPFFLNNNEQFVRKLFAQIRSKLPRQHYSALSAGEGEMMTKIRELSAILEVTYALNSIGSFHRLLEFTLEMALAVTGGERAFIMLFNEELNRLETVSARNFPPAEITEDMAATASLVGKVFESGQGMIGPSHKFRPEGRRVGKTPEDAGILSIAAVPLVELGSIIGVLYVDTKHSGKILTARTDQLMKIFAAQAAVAINRARMFHNATTDPQTGIANQNFFLKRLGEEFCRAQRHQKPMSLILMDLDHFKKLNQIHGESNGNRVLKEVGRIFRSVTRIHDLVARSGADTFAMLLPETAFEGAKVVAGKLKSMLDSTKIRAGSRTLQITASFGIASTTRSTTRPGDLLKTAEKALKQARKRGGNQIA